MTAPPFVRPRAAVALATTDAEQIAVRRNQLHTYRQQSAAATAQQKKADVRLAYAELHTPIAGIINVRAARAGEARIHVQYPNLNTWRLPADFPGKSRDAMVTRIP